MDVIIWHVRNVSSNFVGYVCRSIVPIIIGFIIVVGVLDCSLRMLRKPPTKDSYRLYSLFYYLYSYHWLHAQYVSSYPCIWYSTSSLDPANGYHRHNLRSVSCWYCRSSVVVYLSVLKSFWDIFCLLPDRFFILLLLLLLSILFLLVILYVMLYDVGCHCWFFLCF